MLTHKKIIIRVPFFMLWQTVVMKWFSTSMNTWVDVRNIFFLLFPCFLPEFPFTLFIVELKTNKKRHEKE